MPTPQTGIRMVMPSNAYQAKGLLTAALRADFPIIFFEHRMLYKKETLVPDEDYVLPLDRGVITREGSGVSILAYGYLTELAGEAAKELAREGIDVEVVDLVSLKPLDKELIIASARKTKKVLILDEEPVGEAGLYATIYTLITSVMPGVTIAGLGAEPIPLPFGERAKWFLPDIPKIKASLLELCA